MPSWARKALTVRPLKFLFGMNRSRASRVCLLQFFIWGNWFRSNRVRLLLSHPSRQLFRTQVEQPMPDTGKQEREDQEKDEERAGLLRLRQIVHQQSGNGSAQ